MPPSAGSPAPLERLKRSVDFTRVQSTGRRHRSARLVMVAARGDAGVSRFGLAVSRKVGNAVRRNRVKRWLREAVRAVPPLRGGPWDVVFIARPEAAEAGFSTISSEVSDLLGRLRP